MPHHVSLSIVTRSEKDWLPAFHLLADLAMAHGDQFAQMSVSSVDFDDMANEPEDVEEYHDEETLGKVHNAIRTELLSQPIAVGDIEIATEDIVLAMQNAGILFREIKK